MEEAEAALSRGRGTSDSHAQSDRRGCLIGRRRVYPQIYCENGACLACASVLGASSGREKAWDDSSSVAAPGEVQNFIRAAGNEMRLAAHNM